MSKKLIFSSFFIKIAAFVLMAADHVGLALVSFFPYDMDLVMPSNILRGFGRLALPLFVFMIVEGVIHTKNIRKYLLRLGIMASIISTILIVITYADFGINLIAVQGMGNPFIDLILVAIAVYFIKHDNKYLRFITLLPLGISIASFAVKSYEYATGNAVLWYPNWLYLQYDWFSLVLGIGFYLAYKGANLYIEFSSERGINSSIWEADENKRFLINIISFAVILFASIVFYLFKYINPAGTFWDANLQLFAIISGAFVLLYNGKRGYNAKWFQYSSYLFYIVHITIIILICILIKGGM